MTIVAQVNEEVKNELTPADLGLRECSYGGCHEIVFRRGFCFDHFVEEEDRLWEDDRQMKRAILESVGF